MYHVNLTTGGHLVSVEQNGQRSDDDVEDTRYV